MNKGFTLIEIIAVLVLLGVLAAVIVPRYNSIIDEAKTSGLQQAVAEGMSRVSHASAAYVLRQGVVPDATVALADLNLTTPQASGDFSLAFAAPAATCTESTQVGTQSAVPGDTFTGPSVAVTATYADGSPGSATGCAMFPTN